MSHNIARKQIALGAARLLREGAETDYVQAKRRAARQAGYRHRPTDLPSTREIRVQLDNLSELLDDDSVLVDGWSVRIAALNLLRGLARFGAEVVTESVQGDELITPVMQIVAYAKNVDDVANELRREPGLEGVHQENDIALQVGSDAGAERSVASLVFAGEVLGRVLVLDPWDQGRQIARDGQAWITADAEHFLLMLQRERPHADLMAELAGLSSGPERFELYRRYLEQLGKLRHHADFGSAQDGLHHALQLFDLVLQTHPHDEELLTAALLHEVGKLEDRRDTGPRASVMLEGYVTRRSRWLIENMGQPDRAFADMAVRQADDWDDLQLLVDLDKQARHRRMKTSSLEEALEYLMQLDAEWEEAG